MTYQVVLKIVAGGRTWPVRSECSSLAGAIALSHVPTCHEAQVFRDGEIVAMAALPTVTQNVEMYRGFATIPLSRAPGALLPLTLNLASSAWLVQQSLVAKLGKAFASQISAGDALAPSFLHMLCTNPAYGMTAKQVLASANEVGRFLQDAAVSGVIEQHVHLLKPSAQHLLGLSQPELDARLNLARALLIQLSRLAAGLGQQAGARLMAIDLTPADYAAWLCQQIDAKAAVDEQDAQIACAVLPQGDWRQAVLRSSWIRSEVQVDSPNRSQALTLLVTENSTVDPLAEIEQPAWLACVSGLQQKYGSATLEELMDALGLLQAPCMSDRDEQATEQREHAWRQCLAGASVGQRLLLEMWERHHRARFVHSLARDIHERAVSSRKAKMRAAKFVPPLPPRWFAEDLHEILRDKRAADLARHLADPLDCPEAADEIVGELLGVDITRSTAQRISAIATGFGLSLDELSQQMKSSQAVLLARQRTAQEQQLVDFVSRTMTTDDQGLSVTIKDRIDALIAAGHTKLFVKRGRALPETYLLNEATGCAVMLDIYNGHIDYANLALKAVKATQASSIASLQQSG